MRMESFCVNAAVAIVANTEELREDFERRYADKDPGRFVTITNGFEDLPSRTVCSNNQFTLVHAGALYFSRNPLNFLRAVSDIVKEGIIPTEIFKVKFVGGISVVDVRIESELCSNVMRNVLEIIPNVSHDEVLLIQESASALFLIQTGFPLQVPRKLYEYISIARPILAIAEQNSATARMINDLHLGYVVNDDVISIKEGILSLYENWKSGNTASYNDDKLHAYSNKYLSERLRNIILAL
jgi:hypothetical protein